jgi:hypothetical protein
MADKHANFAYSTVLTAPSPASSGTSLVVQSGDGAKFPTPPFNATVWPVNTQPTTSNAEIVRVTAISTDTFTITRAQEDTTARSIVVGDQIAATITAKTLTDVEPTLNRWANFNLAYGRTDSAAMFQVRGSSNGTMYVAPLVPNNNIFPGNMTANTMLMNLSGSHTNTSSSTLAKTYSFFVGIYTVSGSSTLNLLNSVSAAVTAGATSNQSSAFNGPRYVSFHSSAWSSAPVFTPAHYYVGYFLLSSGEALAGLSWRGQGAESAQRSGTFGTSVATATSMGLVPFFGQLTVSTNALPATINNANISKGGSLVMLIPQIIFENELSAF